MWTESFVRVLSGHLLGETEKVCTNIGKGSRLRYRLSQFAEQSLIITDV